MKPLLRTVGVAVLATALMNAAAGLCFCHRGPAPLGPAGEPGGCCHGPAAPAGTAVGAPSSCCHIESVESSATPVVAVQLAPPAPGFTILDNGPSAADVRPNAGAVLGGASPPVSVLRI